MNVGEAIACSSGLSEVAISQINGKRKTSDNPTSSAYTMRRPSRVLGFIVHPAFREFRRGDGEDHNQEKKNPRHRTGVTHPQIVEGGREQVERVEQRRAGRVA